MRAIPTRNKETKVFIVDDDPATFDSIKHYLRNAPYTLTWCQTAQEALSHIQENDYDVYIFDYKIDQDSGIDLFNEVKHLLEEDSNVIKPALLLTGHEEQEIAIKALQAGFSDMLQKSKLNQSSITQSLDNIIEKYERHRQVSVRNAKLEQMNQALMKKNAEITYFSQAISRELKEPLASINEYISLIMEGYIGDIPQEHKEYLTIAYHNCQIMKLCINDFLDGELIEDDKLVLNKKQITVDSIVESVISSFQHSASTRNIKLNYHPKTPNIKAMIDESRIFHVISNLISNAIKFSTSDSAVMIRSYLIDENNFCFSVEDQGPGIEQIHQKRIFNRLFQVELDDSYHNSGLGIGLSICREIVERHHGKIWVDSEVGSGSTFYVQLPIC